MEMPDFEKWGHSLEWHEGFDSSGHIAQALKQAFDQGRVLGQREALCNTQEWWEHQDVAKQAEDK